MQESHREQFNSPVPAEEGSFDIQHLFYLVIRRLWIIALIVAIGMLIVIPQVVNKPRTYRSTGVLKVEQREQKVLNSENVAQELPGSIEYLNTVISAITSRPVMLSVVRQEGLANNRNFNPERKFPGDQIAAILASQVDAHLRKGTRLIEVSVTNRDPAMACTLATAVIREFLKEIYRQRSQISHSANEFLSDEAMKLKEKLKDSEHALQKYKEEHDAISLQQNQNIIVEKLHQLSAAVTAAQDQKLKTEADLELFRSTDPSRTEELLKIPSVAALSGVTALNQQINQAQAELASYKERYLSKHPKYIAAMNRIHSLELALSKAVANAGNDIVIQHDIASKNVAKLEASLKEQEAKSLELDKLSVEYNVLMREVESDTTLYSSVIRRMKETGISMETENTPFTVLEEPLPGRLVQTNAPLLLGGAFLLLTVLATAAVIVLDLTGSSVRSVDQAEVHFGLPVLGSIPEMHHEEGEYFPALSKAAKSAMSKAFRTFRASLAMHDKDKKISEKDVYFPALSKAAKSAMSKAFRTFRASLAMHGKDKKISGKDAYFLALSEAPGSAVAESFRTFRASLAMHDKDKKVSGVTLITSAIPEEGKTLTSINTALCFAKLGEKTLLIDTDLRRPSLHHILLDGVEGPGLSDLLEGTASLEHAIHPTSFPGLFLIPAGKRTAQPAELLAKGGIPALFDAIRPHYANILLDTAPVNAVSDTLIIAHHADRVCLLIQAEKTPLRVIQRALHLIHQTGAKISGTILNRLSRGGAGYYYYYYAGKYGKDSVYGQSAPS